MRFGIFTCGYQRNKLENAFIDAKKYGYDFMELWGGRPHAYPYDLEICAEGIKKLSLKYGIPITIYTPEMNAYPFNMMWENDQMRKDSIEYVKKSIDFAVNIDAEYVLISAGHAGHFASRSEILDRLESGLREILDYAKEKNMKIIYEPLTIYESNVSTSANDLVEVMQRLDYENFYTMIDIVVPFIQGENIMSYFEKLGDKLIHLHIIDSDGSTESHICPGEGVLPLEELMADLKNIGYDKTITLELVTNYINEPRFYSKRAIENIKSYL